MATVGQPLLTPEEGWKRYDDRDKRIIYVSGNAQNSNSGAWQSTMTGALSPMSINILMKFKFYGTKVRLMLIGQTVSGNNGHIIIDGVTEDIPILSNPPKLSYEKVGLELGYHDVTIYTLQSEGAINYFNLDCIDIDSTGRLLHPDEVTDPKDLAVGKRIRCHYTASANTVGAFSGLGKETSDFIPPASSAAVNGDFYYIMVEDWNGKKRLVADRNIQHSISWDVLNASGIASGSGLPLHFFESVMPAMTGPSDPIPYSIIQSSQYSNTYAGWNAFDKKESTYWQALTTPAWLQVETEDIRGISAYSIKGFGGTGYYPRAWNLLGSNDGSVWIIVDSRSGVTWTDKERKVFNLSKESSYKKYKFEISSNQANSNGYINIAEIELLLNPIKEFNFTTRLLTGGTIKADDNEWEKHIVKSTLGETTIAGDNSTWNWSGTVRAWTSTTYASASYNNRRVQRGGSSVDNFITQDNNLVVTSSSSTSNGFRPVLEIESLFTPIKKSFLSVSDGYKKLSKGNSETLTYSDNVVPDMTSNTTPSGTVSASAVNPDLPDQAWKAFDKSVNTTNRDYWYSGIVSALDGGHWLKYDFGVGVKKKINRISLITASRFLKDFILYGSNDDITYVEIYKGTHLDNTDKQIYSFPNDIEYRYYRINVISNNDTTNTYPNNVCIVEMEMMEGITITPATPSSWQTVSPILPTITQFQEEGMDDLSPLDRKVQTVMESPKGMTSEVLGVGKVLKATVNLNKYFDLRKLEVK